MLKINFAGRNIDVTPALKNFATEKLSPLEKRSDHISHINVNFHVERVTQIAEATAVVDGNEIHASAKDEDMYVAIGLMAEKLIHQITKHKERLIDSHR